MTEGRHASLPPDTCGALARRAWSGGMPPVGPADSTAVHGTT